MTRPECSPIHDDLADLVAGDSAAIERHSEHLASCDDCRDARYEAEQLVTALPQAGADHVLPNDFVERLLARIDRVPAGEAQPALAQGSLETVARATQRGIAVEATKPIAPARPGDRLPAGDAPIPITSAPKRRVGSTRLLVAFGATAALAVGGFGIYKLTRGGESASKTTLASGDIGTVKAIERASKDAGKGLELRVGNDWRPLRANDVLAAGAELRTDERTRAAVELADGSRFTLDHRTSLVFAADEARHTKLAAGRIVADIVHVDGRPALVETPSGRVDVVGTRFALTTTDKLTVVQVVRGAVVLASTKGQQEEVRAGEEGVIDNGALAVSSAPGLAREVEWSELGPRGTAKDTETGAGLGALRAYKPGESRDRDWKLTLANHDVKVRIVGPVARTEITETFRNDTDHQLEGVYQFPLPADAQIDALALDVKDAPGGFEEGAFLDKQRAQKIWKGVIDKAAPKKLEIAQNEIIWVEGSWRDPALLDWKRGGRFELRIFPIPAKGARTIKIAYTQIVTPRGPWRQYVYPLPHSSDGSTVADQMSVDVEVRGSQPGQVRTAGYDMTADPARADVNARSLKQSGFVPRGDLVVDYRATDGDAELRAWTFAGNFAVGPDEKLAAKKGVGNDEKVTVAQRAVASDARPTAVLALRPKLPRWREAKSRDYVIVVDASQSMVGERYTRASELVARLVEQMDRRDQFTVMACDSECRKLGALRSPTVGAAKELGPWLAAQPAAGASDIVAAVRTATADLPQIASHERWIVYVGDGFASTGFRKSGDVEKAIAETTKGVNVTTIGIGTDADSAVLAAVARGGGGSYLAWVPGQSVKSAAIATLESTFGTALRNATVTLPTGLADVAPSVLPTVRSGDEVLVAARMTGEVAGDVVLKGTVGGQPFEQRYPVKLAVSTAAGNGFVPRLWASLAIEQIEQKGSGEDRARIVALSQGYGVMSKETSLLVLESAAMFDAFGVDRTVPAAKWTGQEALDEVLSTGLLAVASNKDPDKSSVESKADAPSKDMKKATKRAPDDESQREAPPAPNLAPPMDPPPPPAPPPATKPAFPRGATRTGDGDLGKFGGRGARSPGAFAMRRTWVRVPSIAVYDSVTPSITKAIGDAERSLAKSPDSRERHRALVQALSYAGEIDRANELAAKWLDRDRLDPQALGYQADLLGRDGKREVALRMLAGVVDLDADRKEPHERMVQAYEHAGRIAQACSHRIALSSIQTGRSATDGKTAAGAIRCLRSLSRNSDADLVLRSLADDTTRAAAEKELQAAAPAATGKQDLVVEARWDGGDDLDVSLVTPDGTRISWMGGRSDVRVVDATSTAKEQLSLKSLKRGNYLIEIGRGGVSAGTQIARGTLDINVLGSKKSLPFELTGTRKTVGRISINLEERIETIDFSATKVAFGNIPNATARRVMLARSGSIQQCFTSYMMQNPGASGRMMLTITVQPGGSTQTKVSANAALAGVGQCVEQNLASMHVEGTAAGSFRVPLTFAGK